MRGRITKASIDALTHGVTLWDSELRGFGARKQNATVTYVLKYRVGRGRAALQRFYKIGRHGSPWTPDQARIEAKRLLGQISQGLDPSISREDETNALTVRTLAETFLTEHVQAKRKAATLRDYGRIVKQRLIPALGSRRVDQVTRADIARLHQAMSGTPRHANLMLSVASKMFNWAVARGYRTDGNNPARHIERYRESMRDRYLSAEELNRLGEALRRYETAEGNLYAAAAIRLLIFTGARLSEILTLRWTDVDFERRHLALPDSKTGAKRILINAPTAETLASCPRQAGNVFVICGAKAGSRLVNLQKPWRKIRGMAGLHDVRLHDLRHSFAAVGASAGMSLPIIGKLLGHSQQATTARYAHIADSPAQAASERIGAQISAAMQTSQITDAVDLHSFRGAKR